MRRTRVVAATSERAWLLAPVCLAAVAFAVALLGPPLGDLLPQGNATPWPSTAPLFRPEATEHARYAIALTAPLLLVAAIVLATRRRLTLSRPVARLVPALQVLALAFVIVCIVGQYRSRVEGAYTQTAGTSSRTVYFTPATLVVASAIGIALALVARNRTVTERIARLVRDTPRQRLVAWALAVLAIAISLLPAIQLESTLFRATISTWYHMFFTFDETAAVLDGRSPLVDFVAQYGSLWPYALAAGMSLLGASIGTFTALTTLLTGASLLALFAVLRRLVASALIALLLFLPLLATSLYKMNGTLENRYSLATLTGMFPLRLAGPLLLLWLTARQLDGARPFARWPLFVAGGLVVLNNVEFGVPACAATLAALLWARGRARPPLGLLALELVGGLAGALALVSALTAVRAGSLPRLGLLTRYSELFGGAGFGMFRIVPTLGVALIVFLTYVAAIGVATVRAVDDASDRLLTGLLAWSGVFGLGIGAYYVGRSHPEVLTNMFPAWALSLVLLTVVVLRDAVSGARLPPPAGLAVLVGFGVLVCSLAQTPTPWSQLRRLGETTPERIVPPDAVRFVRRYTHPGDPVAILTKTGHALALKAGVVNVTPYTGTESMPAREQLAETLRMLRQANGRAVFVGLNEPVPEAVQAVRNIGFRPVMLDERAGLLVLSRR
jgi:hypothetical protein